MATSRLSRCESDSASNSRCSSMATLNWRPTAFNSPYGRTALLSHVQQAFVRVEVTLGACQTQFQSRRKLLDRTNC